MKKLLLSGALVLGFITYGQLSISHIDLPNQPKCDKISGLVITDLYSLEKEVPNDYTGYLKECFEDDVFLLAECSNGKINGSVKIWLDGKLSSNDTWIDGSPFNTLQYEWHENGTLKKEVGYIAGDMVHSYCWDESGNEIQCPESNDEFRFKRYEKSTLNYDEDSRLITFKSNGNPVNGIVYENWDSGQLMEETTVEEGKFNGTGKKWYEDGTIEAEAIFNNGELTFHKIYYQNGNLFQMAHMQNGMPKDTAKVFYPDGSLLSNYIFINGEYSDGICYNPSGEIINCDLINNGIRVEETNIEDKPKPEIIRNNITNQPIDGLLMKSYSDGAPWYHQCYKNGVMHGYAAAWHENGEIMYTTNYIDGKENGIQRQFYPNGQMRSESEYKDHVPHGFQKTWYEDGTLKGENNFLNGEPHGSVKRYDAAGKLIKHGKFKNGVLVSEDCFENGKKVDCE